MGTFVTDTGFQKKTLAELQTEYEELLISHFGEGIDLDPEGPFGQLAGTLSKRDSDLNFSAASAIVWF
jgi:hypothetical protein